MLTTEQLVLKWKQLAIANRLNDSIIPMAEKFSECLGIQDGVAVFIIDGMNRALAQSQSLLAVGSDGFSCWEYAVTSEPYHVGDFIELHTTDH